MRNRFDRQLEELHVELIEMGSMCEDVIRKTSKLLQSGMQKWQRRSARRTAILTNRSVWWRAFV